MRAIWTTAIVGLALVHGVAYGGETSLRMRGDAGDYITGGASYFYTTADGSFTAMKNFDNGVSIAFNTPTFSHFWYVDFAAPFSALLTPGSYPNATRFPFQLESEPGLSISGDGRGCNTLTGSFTVLQIEYGTGNEIVRFWAQAVQHCEGAPPAARAEIKYNADVPVPALPTTWGAVKALYR